MNDNIMRRLEIEREQIFNMRRDGLLEIEEIEPLRGYSVTLRNILTYVKTPEPVLSEGPHIFDICVPSGYPRDESPIVSFRSFPPCHPNIYKSGNICLGSWSPAETLKSLILRVIRLTLLEKRTFNFSSPADTDAAAFVKKCGTLPDISFSELFGDII